MKGENEEDSQIVEEDVLGKFGFKQNVILDMHLPGGERETIDEY